MEVPPAPPITAASPTAATAATVAAAAASYPESIDSSPRSRHTESLEADPPLQQQPQMLRLMCSYGGHIVPRPHDKTLCYIGGDTRIIVIDRSTSLAELHHRLSKTLFHNQSFTLKYQIPNEDLDSLISVTTDEDLENMVEEYDRLNNASGGLKRGRLRLFLFPNTPSNIDQLLVETASIKSDDWFFSVLNGKSSNLSAAASDLGFSESSSVNCLLGLDDDSVGKAAVAAQPPPQKDAETQIDGSKISASGNGNSNVNVNGNVNAVINHDAHSVPDSPMLETTSSFGSASSSPSLANLPPIRVHVGENPKVGLGIEEQFQQMSMGVAGNVNQPPPLQKQGDVAVFVPSGVTAPGNVVSGVPVPVVVGGEAANRIVSDDERSDHGGYRKVQQIQPQGQGQVQIQPQQIPQFQIKQSGALDLASPDSISSEGSVSNPLSRQRQGIYQESILQMQSGNTAATANQTDPRSGDQSNTKVQVQVQEPSHVLPAHFDQSQTHSQLHHPQQFVHAGNQYIPAGAVPVASYYPFYAPQQQHNPHQPMLDQQYPFYYMPIKQTQAYNLPVHQSSYSELVPSTLSSRPQMHSPASLPPHMTYNQVLAAPSSKPEMGSGVYRTNAATNPQLVQIPSMQHQAQYIMHHPSQSGPPPSSSVVTPTYEFSDPTHAQIYFTQPLPPHLAAAAQYQAPSVVSTESSAHIPGDNAMQQQQQMQMQPRTSQQ